MPRLISPLIHPCLIVVAISIALEQQNFGSTDYFFSPLCPCTRTKSMKSSFRLQHLIKKKVFLIMGYFIQRIILLIHLEKNNYKALFK